MISPDLADAYRRDGHWRPQTLTRRFFATCQANAERVAIADAPRRLTFGDAAVLVDRICGHLMALGVRPGDVVSWQLPGWWEAAVLQQAILLAGAIPNPLNPILRARELRFVLAEARPRVLVVPASFRGFDHAALALELRGEIDGLEHVVVVRGEAEGARRFDEMMLAHAADAPAHGAPRTEPSAPALLMYTSGTTSDPKGVVHSHETLLYEIESLREVHAITPEDCYLGGSPVTHIAGLVYGLLMPFTLGTRTALMERWDAGEALALIERERCTFQTGAPTFLQALAEHPDAARRDLSSFRLFSTGGANISTEQVREAGARLGCVVKRAYGSTEVPTLTATSMDDPEDARLETDGRVIGAAEMRLVRDGRDVAPGEEGEIWARSPEVFLGYRNEALNAECFTPDGWFRTGDLGRLDDRGYLRVTGRIKDIIIRGGENISAKELEDLLAQHPAVAEVAVVGVPDARLGERACAVVALRAGATLAFDEMVAFLSAREIATQKLPERLEVRDTLPKTASGKVRKAELRAELAGGAR